MGAMFTSAFYTATVARRVSAQPENWMSPSFCPTKEINDQM
jgi:hypothetical protein